jgi:SAM-dependent methyltransferase
MDEPTPDASGAPDPSEYGERIADVYDQWFPASPEQVTPVVDFLARHAAGGPALELGVGTGRVALPLAARGVAVSGIDASPRMLARLRAKDGGGRLAASLGNFADVTAGGGPFQLVYVVFNTFFGLLTQAEQVRCFRNVAANLRPGGAFVIEAFVPDLTRWDRGQRVQVDALTGAESRLGLSVHDQATQRVTSRDIVISAHGTVTYPVEIRYAWPSELDLMAQLAGLETLGRWGGWRDEPFTSASTAHVSAWTPGPASPG